MKILTNIRRYTLYILCGILLLHTQDLGADIVFSSPQSAISVNGGSFYVRNTLNSWDGTLDLMSGSVSGATIGFTRGTYTTSLSGGFISGQFNPTSQTVTLTGAQRLRAQQGFAVPAVNIGGTANVIEGSPNFSGVVTLNTAATELQMNIQSKLNQNIVLNGGTVTLLDDLALEDDVLITGSGSVNLNYKTLNLPALASTWAGKLLFKNPSDVKLNAKTSLSGTWTFQGNSVLNGNGNILDLTSGGTIFVTQGSSVQFTDVHIKGLGSTLGSLLFGNAAAQARLSNCTLEFSGNYTLTTGGIYIEGDRCNIITGTNTLTLANNASMTVDKVTAYGDALSATSTVNISPNIPNILNLVYLNNGIIKAAGASGGDTALTIATSNAVAGLLVAVSNASVATNNLAVSTSNAVNGLLVATSNAVAGLLVATSNVAAGLVVANSYAIVATNSLAVANSNCIVSWITGTSNAVNGLLVATSNAVAGLVVANSYAIVAAKQLAVDDSNALVSWGVGTSNAVNGLLVATSNAVAGLLVSVSNATVAGQNFNIANSNAIVTINTLNIANSYAVVNAYNLAASTSNAVLALSAALQSSNSLAIDNSNAIVGWIKATSNAVAGLVVANSYAIVAAKQLAVANSTAITGWIKDTSNVVSGGINSQLAIDNSNAIIGWVKDTSNAVAGLLVAVSNATLASGNALAIANSNAIVGWVKDTSNAVAGLLVAVSNATVGGNVLNTANSNAIVTINNNVNIALSELYTIDHGPANIHFNSSTVTMSFDVYLSPDHKLYQHVSGVVDGDTHGINFTTSANSIFVVDAGVTVTLQNVELNGIAPEAISLGSGSQVMFGEGCRLRLMRGVALSMTWSFVGNAVIDGSGNELNLSIPDALRVADGKTLTINNTIITGLGGAGVNNLRLMGAGAGLNLSNVHLILSSNFNFTLGSINISGDSVISGSGSTFAYTSPQACTIGQGVSLRLDKGLTFSYDSSSATKTKLAFAGAKSTLHLDGCTVHATHTGLQLSGGTMIVDDTVIFRNEASNLAEASVISSSLSMYVLGGGMLQMGNGITLYQ